MTPLTPGLYRHFKGDLVEVIGVARHSETKEEYVVYRHLGAGESAGLWIRPIGMFLEHVEKEGIRKPRFALVGREEADRAA